MSKPPNDLETKHGDEVRAALSQNWYRVEVRRKTLRPPTPRTVQFELQARDWAAAVLRGKIRAAEDASLRPDEFELIRVEDLGRNTHGRRY